MRYSILTTVLLDTTAQHVLLADGGGVCRGGVCRGGDGAERDRARGGAGDDAFHMDFLEV